MGQLGALRFNAHRGLRDPTFLMSDAHTSIRMEIGCLRRWDFPPWNLQSPQLTPDCAGVEDPASPKPPTEAPAVN